MLATTYDENSNHIFPIAHDVINRLRYDKSLSSIFRVDSFSKPVAALSLGLASLRKYKRYRHPAFLYIAHEKLFVHYSLTIFWTLLLIDTL